MKRMTRIIPGPRVRLSPAVVFLLAVLFLLRLLEPEAAALDVSYTPRIEGAPDRGIEQLLKDVSDSFSLRAAPPAGLEMLRLRAGGDTSRMVEIMRSEGYYGAKVTPLIEDDSIPLEVRFVVDAGPLYTIEDVQLKFGEFEDPFQDPALERKQAVALVKGATARASDIVDASRSLVSLLRNNGYPFATAARPRVLVNHSAKTVDVELHFEPGPYALFGPLRVFGLDRVEEAFVISKQAWKEGEPYSASSLERTRDRLIRTGLFASVDLRPAESADSQGRLPIHALLRERKHRTVALGLRYRTDEGPGLQGSWTHRNLLGSGERLSLDSTVSKDRLAAETVFRKPEFLRLDQALVAEAGTGRESPEAFSSKHIRAAVGLERQISSRLTAGAGAGFKLSRVEHLGREEDFGLFSLPMRLDWDSSDDLLNPTEGLRLGLRLAPFTEVFDRDLRFVRGYASLSHYLRLAKNPDLVLATRWALGSILGASLLDIPADERFYAGGGGSIRGISYQTGGSLDGSTPVGGRSLMEVSFEFRLRVTPTIGLVGFLDGGRAFESSRPGTGGSMLWGAGMGIRYFTFLGPLRLDVAVPLDRRRGVDSALQFYLSIGQAF